MWLSWSGVGFICPRESGGLRPSARSLPLVVWFRQVGGKPTVRAGGSTMIIAEVAWEGLFPILEKAVQLLFVIAILSLGVWVWTATRKTRLKNNMVERGFSASEIEEVMKS